MFLFQWSRKLLSQFKTEALVGSLILLVLLILVVVSIRFTGNRIGSNENTYNVMAYLKDAAGLNAGTAVRVAGITVGAIEKIELVNGQARLTLQIRKSVPLYADAILAVKSLGILGDRFILLYQGSPMKDTLRSGDQITYITSEGNIDEVINSVEGILKDIKGITASLNDVLGGQGGATRLNAIMNNIQGSTQSLDKILSDLSRQSEQMSNNLNGTLSNLHSLTGNLDQTLKESHANLVNIIADLAVVTKSLKEDMPGITSNVRGILEENRNNLRSTMEELDQASYKLKNTMANLEKSTNQIASGEGTVGKLINDKQTGEDVAETLKGLNHFITEANRSKLDLGFQLEYQKQANAYKGYVSLYYIPSPDHYFIFQIVDSPKNASATVIKDEKVTSGTDTTSTHTVTTTNQKQYTISLQIAQRYFDTVFRVGLFENTFGTGVDQNFGSRETYRLSAEAWDFNRTADNAHLKIFGSYKLLGNLYIIAGLDDFNSVVKSNRQAFFGIKLDFNEDPLKLIASSLPLGSVTGTTGH